MEIGPRRFRPAPVRPGAGHGGVELPVLPGPTPAPGRTAAPVPFARCRPAPTGLSVPDRFCIVMPMKRPGDGRAARVARRSSATVFLFLLLLPVAARAGDWRVSPIRLDLGRDAKSGAVTVANDSDDRLQVR